AESHARFQAVIAALASRCASTRGDRIDAVFTEVLAELGDALEVDRCVAYLPTSDGASHKASWTWCRVGGRVPPDDFDPQQGLPYLMGQTHAGESVAATTIDAIPDAIDGDSLRELGAGACAAVPLVLNGARGALVVDTASEREWPDDVMEGLRLVAAVMGQVVGRQHDRERHDVGLNDLRRQRQQTLNENAMLRREMTVCQSDRTIASESVAIRRVLEQVQQVA